jgi:DNA-binding NtrC family response regulator
MNSAQSASIKSFPGRGRNFPEAGLPGQPTSRRVKLKTAQLRIHKGRYGHLVGKSAGMRRVYSQIEKTARVNMPVLLIGDTGTGKELVAREIHFRSQRKEGPFVPVNMGAIPRELVASELFGHVKGAFTGALEQKLGRFAEAKGGTLFLDEISTMDEKVQIALLRVLETRRFRRLGGKQEEKTDVRLITATNVEPYQSVQSGRFRQDLLQRIEVLRITLPPLKKRKADIPLLVEHFLDLFKNEFDLDIQGISQEALKALKQYDWPGNVRELKNVLVQAAVTTETDFIELDHLPTRILNCLTEKQSPAPVKAISTLGREMELLSPGGGRERSSDHPSNGICAE